MCIYNKRAARSSRWASTAEPALLKRDLINNVRIINALRPLIRFCDYPAHLLRNLVDSLNEKRIIKALRL